MVQLRLDDEELLPDGASVSVAPAGRHTLRINATGPTVLDGLDVRPIR